MRMNALPAVIACLLFLGTLPALAEHRGKVLETMDSGGYTYVMIDSVEEGKLWLAGPQTKIEVGQELVCGNGMAMANFESPTLKRSFKRIFFVSRFGDRASAALTHDPHQGVPGAPKLAGKVEPPAPGSIPKAGVSIAELRQQAEGLAGKLVEIRGRAMKVNANIMGKTWVHLSYGSGDPKTDDLVVTTHSPVIAGSLVVVRGTVRTNVDLGAGYRFAVLVEDAEVRTEAN